MMIDILAPLIQSPILQEHFIKLKDYIKEEQQKRKDFYDFVTEDMKAEFINGEVIIQSSVTDEHESTSLDLVSLMHIYTVLYKLGRVTHEKLMIALTRNNYEPDICFFSVAKSRKFKEGQKLFPAPDFIAEVISRSTEKIDRGIKFEDYALHGVKEYWIIDPKHKTIEKYLLVNKKYELEEKLIQGDISSKVVKGFKIPVKAIFDKTQFAKTLAIISNKILNGKN
ncbi:MAG: Uma2 family endonuclease [Ferruginibacter sp.]